MDNFENQNEIIDNQGQNQSQKPEMVKSEEFPNVSINANLKGSAAFIASAKKELKTVVLFTIIFSIVCVVLGFFIINSYLDVQVAKHGTLAKATVTDSDYHSGDDDSDPYWTIYYSYVDEASGKTYKDSYSSDYNISRGQQIWIKHNGAGRSVEANHSTSFVLSALPLLIVFILFSLAVCAWIFHIFNTMRKIRIYKKMESGECKFATATYISGYTQDGKKAHVRYMYEDSEGNMHEGKSIEKYDSNKLLYFQNKGNFEIKYVGKYSTIIQKEETLETKAEEIIVRNGAAKCPYCETIIPAGVNECPNCSAKRE